MVFVFELSQEYLDLAQQEVLCFFDKPKYEFLAHFVIIKEDISKTKLVFLSKRLAYTKRISKFLFDAKQNDLLSAIKRFSWKRVYKKDISVKVRGLLYERHKEIIASVLAQLPKKKVNLTDPKTRIQFFQIGNKVYATQLLREVKHDFEKRKAHNRPACHPSAMHPQLTRAMINLALHGRKDGFITDPFVGTGGTILEAHDMHLKSEGFDIDSWMIHRCKTNLEFFHITKVQIIQADATQIKEKKDFVVADLPYGKGTKNISKTLYKEFFSNLERILNIIHYFEHISRG